ncbi:QacE family quaternary ammonium compound efflux SMR transporter, partial [Campylobacter jejuni]
MFYKYYVNLRLHVNEKFNINIAWFLIILGGII